MRFNFIVAGLMVITMSGGAFAQVAAPAPDPSNILRLDLSNGGSVEILLRPDKAPNSVERIKTFARQGFYNGLSFHRVIEGFMAQGGDPKGDGSGGSTLPDLKAEFNDLPHVRGAMAMARAESPDSANSQFFLMLMPNLSLDRHYTVVGRVVTGMEAVDAIEKGEPPANPTKIVRAMIEGNDSPAVAASAPAPVAAPAPSGPTPAEVKEAAERAAMERAMDEANAPR